jgi:PTH1 family peptidyl-tRNA hydrolase
MKLIVGLGNLGEKYKKTRHNAGFLIVDALLDREPAAGVREAAGFAAVYLKPRTGMNSSGVAVKKAVEKNEIKPDNLLIIHDDLDIDLGEYKLQKGRGAAGHNGVQSIIDALGAREFWRLRVGISRPPEGKDPADYVLESFTNSELRTIETLAEEKLVGVVKEWLVISR